nr:MAG TPA: hypothetical protein [Caudoviricetes sp.]
MVQIVVDPELVLDVNLSHFTISSKLAKKQPSLICQSQLIWKAT